MQVRSVKPGDLIYIEWEDAVANSSWHTESEMGEWFEKQNMIVKEVGWVWKKTDKHLAIYSRVTEWSPDDNQYGQLQKIPITWIKKVTLLTKRRKEVTK